MPPPLSPIITPFSTHPSPFASSRSASTGYMRQHTVTHMLVKWGGYFFYFWAAWHIFSHIIFYSVHCVSVVTPGCYWRSIWRLQCVYMFHAVSPMFSHFPICITSVLPNRFFFLNLSLCYPVCTNTVPNKPNYANWLKLRLLVHFCNAQTNMRKADSCYAVHFASRGRSICEQVNWAGIMRHLLHSLCPHHTCWDSCHAHGYKWRCLCGAQSGASCDPK